MTRPLRLQFPGALTHITTRGNDKRPTYLDDRDRRHFLDLLAEVVRRFGWIITAYVLMSNHYHLLVELTEENLSVGMGWLNGQYARWFNVVHDRVGHLFQDRPDTPIIDKDTYYFEVLRYIVLNPVRAKMVKRPEDYEWSSYRATAGLCEAPKWLAIDNALILFGEDRGVAQARYKAFVDAVIDGCESPWNDLRGQMYLGSEEFMEKMRDRVELKPRADHHPSFQREIARPTMVAIIAAVACTMNMSEEQIRFGSGSVARRLVAWLARYEGNLTNGQIAAALRLRSDGHVSKMIAAADDELTESETLREILDLCLSTLGRKRTMKGLTPIAGVTPSSSS